jgi:transcriptional regulator NrdR family protein
MKCPRCKSKKTEVLDSRPIERFNGATRRRRSCPKCYHLWTTYEIQQNYLDTMVSLPVEKIARYKELLNELDKLQTLFSRNGNHLSTDVPSDSGGNL